MKILDIRVKALILCIVTISVIKLWLFSAMQITACAIGEYDELLFLASARSILQGKWLGEYSVFTLSKGPIYSLWLAFNHLTGIPLLVSQHLLYMLVGILLVVFLRKRSIDPFYLIFFYFFYLFNPVIELRALRESIYPSLTFSLFTGVVGIYCYKSDDFIKLFLCVLLMSFSLTLFWLVREEGVWMLPSMGVMLSYVIYKLCSVYGLSREFWKRITLIVLLPLAILLMAVTLISSINKVYYGIYTVVETNSTPFVSAIGAVNRVKHKEWMRYQALPEELRKQLSEVSPAFRSIEHFLPPNISMYDELLWLLRKAASRSGFAENGEMSALFYSKLAAEINIACDNGLLDCNAYRQTLMPPLRMEYLPFIFHAFTRGIKYLYYYVDYPPPLFGPRYSIQPYSIGNDVNYMLFKYITNNQVAPLAFRRCDISDKNALLHSVEYQNPEITVDFRSQWEIEWMEIIKKQMDFVIPIESNNITAVDSHTEMRIQILKYVSILFQHTMQLLIFAAAAFYLFMAGVNLYLRRLSFFFVLNTAICLGVFSRLLILSIIDATSFPAMYPWYLSPLYPLIIFYVFANLMDLIEIINHLKNKKTGGP